MPFEIVACGFNAHGQLLPDKDAPAGIPSDIFTPTVVAQARVSAKVLFAGWSETLLELDDKVYSRGAGCAQQNGVIKDVQPPYRAFGDGLSSRIVVFGGDQTEAYVPGGFCEEEEGRHHRFQESTQIVAIAGNGKVLRACGGIENNTRVYAYKSFEDLLSSNPSGPCLEIEHPVIDIQANETAFTLLTAAGTVYTLGDPRHDSLLGRDLSITPGTDPGLVDALDGIKIAQISSGGWLTAALSAERDLYLWGGRGGGDDEQLQDLQGLESDEVALVDLGGGLDVVGVSVGMGHVAALTEDGRVWVVGRAANGQAGAGGVAFCGEWRELRVDVGEGRAVGVVCGGCATFVVVEKP